MLDAVIDRPFETLADHGSHRAAEELELECAGHDGQALQLAREDNQCVALTGGLLCLDEPILVALAVAKFEGILGRDARPDFLAFTGVEKAFQPLAPTDSHVMAAFGADIQVALE